MAQNRRGNRRQPAASTRYNIGASRRARALSAIVLLVDLFLLQVYFLIASLPVVTVVPAAIALQRSLHEFLVDQENAITPTFVKHFKWSLRRYWAPGLAIVVFVLAFSLSLAFWLTAVGWLRIAGLSVLSVMGVLALASYLTGLATVADAERTTRFRELAQQAWARHAAQPVAVAGSVIIFIIWLFLLSERPALALAGAGLVPGLLAHWLNWLRRRKSRPAATTG